MKVTTKWQVTIPARIRDYLGIYPHTNVDFRIAGGRVILVKPDTDPEESGRFLTMRGILKGELSTKKWMQATRGDWWLSWLILMYLSMYWPTTLAGPGGQSRSLQPTVKKGLSSIQLYTRNYVLAVLRLNSWITLSDTSRWHTVKFPEMASSELPELLELTEPEKEQRDRYFPISSLEVTLKRPQSLFSPVIRRDSARTSPQ